MPITEHRYRNGFITKEISKMSDPWQGFVDNGLVGDGATVASGAIIGMDGGTLGSSAGFNLNAGEGSAIVALFNNPGNAFNSGLTVAGTRYLALSATTQSMSGAKGATGVIFSKTATAIVIGYYNAQQSSGPAATAVQGFGDFLTGDGF